MGRGTTFPIHVGEPRPLAREELSALAQQGRTVATVKRLRDSHHMIARFAAVGLDNVAIAEKTGYSRERVGQLLLSPAMKELVACYREKVDASFVKGTDAFFELATSNMLAAERHIADALAEADEAGELIPIKTALAISADHADRFGYGKRQTNVNVNFDFAGQLEKAIKRSGVTIEASPSRPAIHPQLPSGASARSSIDNSTRMEVVAKEPLLRRLA